MLQLYHVLLLLPVTLKALLPVKLLRNSTQYYHRSMLIDVTTHYVMVIVHSHFISKCTTLGSLAYVGANDAHCESNVIDYLQNNPSSRI
jgi:hypothetical protein